MNKISMTHFVDFVLKAGTPRLTTVRATKTTRHDLLSDFYLPLREAMLDMHRSGKPISALRDHLAALEDERKKRIYPEIVKGYEKFLAATGATFFEPPAGTLKMGGLAININPEVGLEIGGVPHLVKLYFRGESLSARRVSITLDLMAQSGIAQRVPGAVLGVLDLRKAKLHTLGAANPRVSLLLRGEAASFSAIYASI
ncbi:MAG: hypothetical protein U0359_01850 [Byssovorax sp.]